MPRPEDLDERALLDLVQRQTLRYFWDFAHPACGLARERSNRGPNYGLEVVTTGGSGFGVMAIIAGVARGWIGRAATLERLLTMARFLLEADRYHGILPHFLHGDSGRTIPFSPKDDGGDLVETAFLLAGLLAARQYFDRDDDRESELRARIDRLWEEAEWSWHTAGRADVLYWHWSPNHGWSMNLEVRGWNECLLAYVLAASAPRHPIDPEVYHRGWAAGRDFRNGREFYGIRLPLGPEYGGPLFFAHYSFLGLDPRGLKDRYADYWEQNVAHVLINREHCIRNPNRFQGYGPDCWGLTASDDPQGYRAHAPNEDCGVIAPTAALSSFPYAPEHAMRALRHFYHDLGDRIWSDYGFVDAFSPTQNWYARSHLAIDQGPIVAMIENHRTGLLWHLLMTCPEIQSGLRRLGFESPHLGSA
ncbi:MAG: beta-glucosidase [Geminicoccaceae bacterium]|jgi:hypothetical protein|nr:beta-glucosidase [Geminicoccaceae bacterium]